MLSFLQRSVRAASTLQFVRCPVSLSCLHRSFGNRRENGVEGRSRLEALGDTARYVFAASSIPSYPPFRVSCDLESFRKKWDYLKNGERCAEEEVTVAGDSIDLCLFVGRIINKRSAGSKLYFYDIRSGEIMLQVMASLGTYCPEEKDPEKVRVSRNHLTEAKTLFKDINKKLRTGDVVGIRGIPGRTDLGELSILPRELTLLAPSLWKIPREWYEIKDPDVKYRKVPIFFRFNLEVPRSDRQQVDARCLLQAKSSGFHMFL